MAEIALLRRKQLQRGGGGEAGTAPEEGGQDPDRKRRNSYFRRPSLRYAYESPQEMQEIRASALGRAEEGSAAATTVGRVHRDSQPRMARPVVGQNRRGTIQASEMMAGSEVRPVSVALSVS